MKINGQNTRFLGNLYLKNEKLWTDEMLQAIEKNESIQKKLQNNDIIGIISTKKERRQPNYFSYHEKGDTLYKARFIIKNEKQQSLLGKIKGIFNKTGKEQIINKHYHSEYTTVERIKDMIMN